MNYTPKHFKLPANYTLTRRDKHEPYVFNDNIAIAVDIALATGRPLLVAGEPGSGKSRLAEAMATLLDWNYLDYTMTSRTRLEDLTADHDHLLRLHDAQTRSKEEGMKPDWAYFKPGVFWWAFNTEDARNRGGDRELAIKHNAILEYPGSQTTETKNQNKTVLLIDEIDKAEPDLPNDLLEPLDRRRFTRPDGKHVEAIKDIAILTIITTNRERELPAAFMRRCVSLVLNAPDENKLIRIAEQHFPRANRNLDENAFTELVAALANKTVVLRDEPKNQDRRPPSTSEFLDALRACDQLGINTNSQAWQLIEKSILIKDLNDQHAE